MSQSESPRDFYHRLENGLSPLIRLMLAEHLPKIGGRKSAAENGGRPAC